MPDPIPGEWLSAATLAIDARRRGSSSAQLAMAVLEAVVPLIRAEQAEGTATEWGACRRGEVEPFTSSMDEAAIRRFAEDLPTAVTGLVRREVTPWTPAAGEDGSND